MVIDVSNTWSNETSVRDIKLNSMVKHSPLTRTTIPSTSFLYSFFNTIKITTKLRINKWRQEKLDFFSLIFAEKYHSSVTLNLEIIYDNQLDVTIELEISFKRFALSVISSMQIERKWHFFLQDFHVIAVKKTKSFFSLFCDCRTRNLQSIEWARASKKNEYRTIEGLFNTQMLTVVQRWRNFEILFRYEFSTMSCSFMIQRAVTRPYFYIILLLVLLFLFVHLTRDENSEEKRQSCPLNSNEQQMKTSRPIVFIGGMPRSGTTLIRAILDSHPMVRCGEETRTIPRMLGMRTAWEKSNIEWNRSVIEFNWFSTRRIFIFSSRLISGGMTKEIIDSAVRAFIFETLLQHSRNSDVLCDKDPFVLKHTTYLSSIFPQGKFLLMIRDARAVIHSVINRKVTITGFSANDYRHNFQLWNKGMEMMYDQCQIVGSNKCLMVFYEKLVLQPRKTIETVLKFLELPWTDDVLHHEQLIEIRISLSK